MIRNRLEKNLKKLRPWADRLGIEAFRVYDRDIPEYPFIVDIYGKYVVVADRREKIDFDRENSTLQKRHIDELREAIESLLQPQDIIFKRRAPQRVGDKGQQYQKLNRSGHCLVIREEPARFIVNLYDYLDTGLFLDHRLLRQRVLKVVTAAANEAPKPPRFLNLFSYTGSVSVFAALGGANVTSVDLSKPYTEWAMANFKENGVDKGDHVFVVADVLEWIAEESAAKHIQQYDFIFVDPPTFSNSKKMTGTFDVQRDHVKLLRSVAKLLKPQGLLFFSNNKRGFKLDEAIRTEFLVKDISRETLPNDFHDPKIRSAFEIRLKS